MPRLLIQDTSGLPGLPSLNGYQQDVGEPGGPRPQNAFNALDLSPLSDTLSNIGQYIRTQQAKDAEAGYSKYQEEFTTNAAAFREKVKNGEIPEFANPVGREWFFQMDSGRQINQFQDEMLGKLNELSVASDGSGKLLPPANFDQAFADTWKKYSGSYSFQTLAGQHMVASTLPDVYDSLRKRYVLQRAQNENDLKRFQIGEHAQDLLTRFTGTQDPTARTMLSDQWNSLFADANKFGTLEVRQLQMKAMKEFLESSDATTSLRNAKSLFGMSLGSGTFASQHDGQQIVQQGLLGAAERARKIQVLEQEQVKAREQEVVRGLNAQWFPKFFASQQTPVAFANLVSEARKQIQKMPGEFQKVASDWLDGIETSSRAERTRQGEELSEQLIDMLDAGDDPQSVQGIRFGQADILTFDQQKRIDDKIAARITNEDVYEGKPYQAVDKAVKGAAKSVFPSDARNSVFAREQLDRELDPIKKQFESDLSLELERLKDSPTRNTDIATWLQNAKKSYAADADKVAQQRQKEFSEFHKKLVNAEKRRQDLSALLVSDEGQRYVHPEEQARLQVVGDINSNPDNDYRVDGVFNQLRSEIALARANGNKIKALETTVSEAEIQKALGAFQTRYRDLANTIRTDETKYPTSAVSTSLQGAKLQALQEAAKFSIGKIPAMPVGDEKAPEARPGTPASKPTTPAEKPQKEALGPAPKEGLLTAGNIDLANRPVVANKDGSISTVRSASFEIDGKEYLLPTVSEDGKILTDQQAVDQFKKTGKHLGAFDTPEHATQYAEWLHRQQEAAYAGSKEDDAEIAAQNKLYADPEWRAKYAEAIPTPIKNGFPVMPIQYLADYKRYMMGEVKNQQAGGYTNTMRDSLAYHAKMVMESKAASDQEKKEAIVSMYQLYGLKPEMIENGKIPIGNPPDLQARLEAIYKIYNAPTFGDPQQINLHRIAAGVSYGSPYIYDLEKRLLSHEMPIRGDEFNPWMTDYGFDSKKELDAMRANKPRWQQFLQKIAVPIAKEEAFYQLQLKALDRNHRI